MDLSFKKSCMTIGFVVAVIFFVVAICSRDDLFQSLNGQLNGFSKTGTNRRFLLSSTADYDGDVGDGTMDRIISGECSKENIYISQGQTSPLPNGIPTYTVQIQNICMPSGTTISSSSSSCSISDIHLSCGWFSSATLINPNVFQRISYNDCLVNNGNPINPGQTISFQYANTYPYPMSVSSLSCY